jgi:RimJ/RimL family protein N-acetyltransferase
MPIGKIMNYKILKRDQLSDSEGYQITAIRAEDIESIRIWRNAQIEVLRQNKPITKEEQVDYFHQNIWPTFMLDKPKQILFSFFFQEQLIGYGGLTSIDWENKRGEISFLLNPERVMCDQMYHRDYSHFLLFLCKIAFEDLHFHRLFSETFDFRIKHMAVLESVGFKKEGVLREHVFKKGTWHHSIMHGLLAKEYSHG